MASFTPSNLLLFGCTGQIGAYIASSILRATPAFASVTLFTSASTSADPGKQKLLASWRAQGMRVTVGDLTSEADVRAAFASSGADTVVSAVGRGALQHQVELLRWAEDTPSVRWFLPSEYGTDIEHNPKSASERPHQLKLKLRAFARENLRRLGVTYVVTGPYFDMWTALIRGAEVAGGLDLEKKHMWMIGDGDGKVGFCTMWDVGKCVVATLRHPEQAFNKAVRVQSFVVSPNEVLAEVEKQTVAKWEVTRTPLDDIYALEAKAWEEGKPYATPVTLRRIWGEGGTLYDKNDNEMVGLRPEDMDPLSHAVERTLKGGWKVLDTF